MPAPSKVPYVERDKGVDHMNVGRYVRNAGPPIKWAVDGWWRFWVRFTGGEMKPTRRCGDGLHLVDPLLEGGQCSFLLGERRAKTGNADPNRCSRAVADGKGRVAVAMRTAGGFVAELPPKAIACPVGEKDKPAEEAALDCPAGDGEMVAEHSNVVEAKMGIRAHVPGSMSPGQSMGWSPSSRRET